MSTAMKLQCADGVYARDNLLNVMEAEVATIPTDGTAGYGPGARVWLTTAVSGATLYVNEGTSSSCAFKRVTAGPVAPLLAGSTLTLTADYNGKWVGLDQLAGSVVTLPAATGSGNRYPFFVHTKATSNSHIVKVANSTDVMQGTVQSAADDADATRSWIAGATADTVTLNRTTTGSVNVGEWLEFIDIKSGVFLVRGVTSSSGTEATPFSATV